MHPSKILPQEMLLQKESAKVINLAQISITTAVNSQGLLCKDDLVLVWEHIK